MFADLLARLEAIAAASPRRRRALMRDGALDRAFRITWSGVREGYDAAALSMRARNGSDFAARYFASASDLVLRQGDVAGSM